VSKIHEIDITKAAMRVTNLIRGGSRYLSNLNFKIFLGETGSVYGDLVLHIELRWLSGGKYLVRFHEL
jgi:hypothetical protein